MDWEIPYCGNEKNYVDENRYGIMVFVSRFLSKLSNCLFIFEIAKTFLIIMWILNIIIVVSVYNEVTFFSNLITFSNKK